MINGWYCRSMASDQGDQDYSNLVIKSETSDDEGMLIPEKNNATMRYKNLKRKLKFLVYENEFLADTLRTSQHNFLKIAKDRSFLLDRLLQYEKPDMSSSESDDTDSSDDDVPMKKKKIEPMPLPPNPMVKRKKIIQKKPMLVQPHPQKQQNLNHGGGAARTNAEILAYDQSIAGGAARGTIPQNIMTTEEVERHLQSRQSLIELRALPTVPTEMFSNEPSLDSEGELS